MNDKMFNELVESIKEAGAINRGEIAASRIFEYSAFDVKKIRKTLNLSQVAFAKLVRINVKTLQNWEQGRRHPKGPALALLTILKNDPEHAIQALN